MNKKNNNLQPHEIILFTSAGVFGSVGFFLGYFILESKRVNFNGLEGVGWGIFLWCLTGIFGAVGTIFILFLKIKWSKSKSKRRSKV